MFVFRWKRLAFYFLDGYYLYFLWLGRNSATCFHMQMEKRRNCCGTHLLPHGIFLTRWSKWGHIIIIIIKYLLLSCFCCCFHDWFCQILNRIDSYDPIMSFVCFDRNSTWESRILVLARSTRRQLRNARGNWEDSLLIGTVHRLCSDWRKCRQLF